MAKKNLLDAKEKKKDEFYTQLSDIENELSHYKKYFYNKTIYCNCDDPYESNFFKYFAINFEQLHLKKLITTCYKTSVIMGEQLSLFDDDNDKVIDKNSSKKPYKIVLDSVDDLKINNVLSIDTIKQSLINNKKLVKRLNGDGDYKSGECIKLLEMSDIVVTNPPFSQFREYLDFIMSYNKDLIVISNTNALTYKEVFKYFKENKIRTGYTNFNKGMYFYVPDTYEKYHKIINGKKMVRVSTSCWLTTLPVDKHNDFLIYCNDYNITRYRKYENYDAINIDTYKDIPDNYHGVMGVPVTFLDKYNPEQFELIGLGIANLGLEIGVQPYKEEHKRYRKEVQRKGAVDGDLYMLDDSGHPDVPYARILIRRKL